MARPPKRDPSTSHEDYDVLSEDEKRPKAAGPLAKAFEALFLVVIVAAIIACVILAMIAFRHGG